MNEEKQLTVSFTAGKEDFLLQRILDIGELMLQSGAEISRVEDTISRLGKAYGATMDVYVIIYSIVVTMTFPDGRVRTQTRRMQGEENTDFDRLNRLNDLSRRCCADPMPPEILTKEITAIRQRKTSLLPHLLGCLLAAFAFSLFFGGTAADGLLAAAFALFLTLLQRALGKYSTNHIFYILLISLLVGSGIGAFCRFVRIFDEELVMIGVIMLINPGVTMMSAVREMIVGNTISGALRLIEATIWTIAMAAGFMLAIHITGGAV